MTKKHVPFISLVVMAVVAIWWQIALNRSYDHGKKTAAQRPVFPVVPVRTQGPDPGGTAEKQLGPFYISGNNYTVVLQQKPRVRGSTQETGDTVVAMEIRDSTQEVIYKRLFPQQSENDVYSDAWSVSAHVVTRNGGTGLMVNYSVDAEPSAPTPEETTWWQLFGVVNGMLRPFSGPLAVQGELLDSVADSLVFKVWAHHASLVFPISVDWVQGKMAPEQNCETAPCEFRVIPKEPGYREDLTFVRFCPTPERCDNPDRVVVKKASKIEVLSCRVPVQWKEGNAVGPSTPDTNSMGDQGEISVPEGNVWLKMRIDGREGWVHDEEDYLSLGMIFEQ